MLFRKKIEKNCRYCSHGTCLDDETVLCAKNGLRSGMKTCMKFRYDPCKRIPMKAKTVNFSKYDQEDYSL